MENSPQTKPVSQIIKSGFLKRDVIIDFYFPAYIIPGDQLSLLLINDGQDLVKMDFNSMFSTLNNLNLLAPLFCIGIHCGPDRRNEYGTAGIPDYKGRGAKAALYTRFIFEELLPFVKEEFHTHHFKDKSFAGFSLGGLSALDIVWNHPQEFQKVGIFSGSLWWRSVSQDHIDFCEEDHRIMHNEIKNGGFYPWLKFFFETGTKDETADRNKNGIIDSIDDTISLINDLVKKGYDIHKDIRYVELSDGRHDVATWARVLPEFLKWGWPIQ